MTVMADTLPDDPGTLKAMLLAERARAERLEQIIKELQRHRFGRRAETLPEDQMLLGLEDVEQVAASSEAEGEAAAPAERAKRAAKRRMNRGSLPAHLPRIEMVVDIEDHSLSVLPQCAASDRRGSERDGSISSRRSCACWSCAGPSMPVGPARRSWCRRPRRRG